MNNTRVPVVIMAVALFSTAILALLIYISTIEAMESSPSSSGMGELRLLEAQQNNSFGGALDQSSPYVGMGELHRFEAPASSHPDIGMGDLRRIEAGQSLTTANVSRFQLPDRVCPNPSTSYGERDSGASAPVYALLAKGC